MALTCGNVIKRSILLEVACEPTTSAVFPALLTYSVDAGMRVVPAGQVRTVAGAKGTQR
jgi:hypothetical protein